MVFPLYSELAVLYLGCWVQFWALQYERCGHTGDIPAKGHEDAESTGVFHL